MRPPRGGLRPIHNRRNDVAKVELRIQAGATLHVQDDVADQLIATGAFAPGDAPAPLLDALDAAHEVRFPAERPDGERGVSPATEPRKSAAKKAAAKKAAAKKAT